MHEAVLSPNGQIVATGGRGGMTLFSLWTGRESLCLPINPRAAVTSLVFSPDRNFLASKHGNEIKLWNLETGKEVYTFFTKSQLTAPLAFSTDSQTLMCGNVWWNVQTGTQIEPIGETDDRSGFNNSPDAPFSIKIDNTEIILHDENNPTGNRRFQGHDATVRTVTLTQDIRMLASGSDEGIIKIWDVTQGVEVATLMAVGPFDWVVYTPEGYFDASPGAMERYLYWLEGFEVRELERYRAYYHRPGLLVDIFSPAEAQTQ